MQEQIKPIKFGKMMMHKHERFCIFVDNKEVFCGRPVEVKTKMTREEFNKLLLYKVVEDYRYFDERIIRLEK